MNDAKRGPGHDAQGETARLPPGRPAGRGADSETVQLPAGRPRPGPVDPAAGGPPAPALTADRVRVIESIGRGGMGEVYRAEQVELERVVAFKQILDGATLAQRERFAREARLTAQLDHPSIVPVYTLERRPDGAADGYTMKLVEGRTLRQVINETALAYERGERVDQAHALATRLEHFLRVCDAVAFAHDRGILHRDLKPANIMVGHFGEVYVMDWGIARPIGAADPRPGAAAARRAVAGPDLTEEGEIFGSASYMSPEQASGKNDELDARSDQYALGLILFELISLRRAITAELTAQLYAAASRGLKAPLEHLSRRERLAPDLRAIVDRATALAPADRYPSVAALAEDVRRWLRGDETLARPDGPLGRLARRLARHRRATLAALVGVLALAAVVVSAALYRQARAELTVTRRAERVTAVFIDVAAQAHRIDLQMQRMQEALEGLRVAAEWALAGPDPGPAAPPVLLDTDFADPARRPADFRADTRYRWPVSLDSPVVGVAPGVDRAALLPKLRRIAPLGAHIRSMIVAAAAGAEARLSASEQRALLASRQSPIDYAYVDLAEGAHMVYPGVDSLPPDYDVRTAGFYTMSAHRRGLRWGRPYVDSTTDAQGDDLVLPCTAGLWSPAGAFVGVVGVEITVTKLVETSLALPGHVTLRTSLLDADGRKVIDSGDAGKRFRPSGKDESLELAEFDIPEIAAAVRARSSTVRQLRHAGRDELVAVAPLGVLGWYYVAELDAARALDPAR